MTTQVNNTPPPDPTTLAPGGYTSTVILNTTFNLLTSVLNATQNVAAAQAGSLQFFSQWQNWYTTRMAEVPTLGTGNDPLGSSPGEAQDANTANSNFIQTMQNRQSVVGDQAKQMQTVVNQSEQAATSAADLGSSMLQELGTLLPIVTGR